MKIIFIDYLALYQSFVLSLQNLAKKYLCRMFGDKKFSTTFATQSRDKRTEKSDVLRLLID
jgi:hypothetical protein